MTENKRCPLCGCKTRVKHSSITGENYIGCSNANCQMPPMILESDWNTRPIEDALNARIAELEAENAELEAEMERLKNSIYSLDIDWEMLCTNKDAKISRLKGEREWIPVSKRLPENGERALVALMYDEVNIGVYNAKISQWEIDGLFFSGGKLDWVSHWKPLPEPPEEEE